MLPIRISIFIKIDLLNWGKNKILLYCIMGGGGRVTLLYVICFGLFINQELCFIIELILKVFVMTKALSNRDILVITAVLLW